MLLHTNTETSLLFVSQNLSTIGLENGSFTGPDDAGSLESASGNTAMMRVKGVSADCSSPGSILLLNSRSMPYHY